MKDGLGEPANRARTDRIKWTLVAVFVLAPVGAFGLAVVGVNLFLLGSELVKILTW